MVERKHHHIIETGLALLAHSSFPYKFWPKAFETAVYIINCLPSKTLHNKSPYSMVHNHEPDFNFLKVFGCECWQNPRPYNKHKFPTRSIPCLFLGYSPIHKGYKCLDLSPTDSTSHEMSCSMRPLSLSVTRSSLSLPLLLYHPWSPFLFSLLLSLA